MSTALPTPEPAAEGGKAVLEVATERSGCYGRCGRVIDKGEQRVRYRPPGRLGASHLFHPGCYASVAPGEA